MQGVGFKEIQSRSLLHRWVPKYRLVIRYLGWRAFHWLSHIYGNFVYSLLPIRRKTKSSQTLATGLKALG